MRSNKRKRGKKIPGMHIREYSINYQKHGPTRFYSTGIADFDEFTGGIPSGEMTIIAARPGDGKTALAMQLMEHIGLFHNHPCGFFSLEMSGESLVTRMIVARTGLPSVALRKGELTDKQRTLRDKAREEINKLPLYIDDSSYATVEDVEEKANLWIDHGIKVLGLDYIQLMKPGNGRMDTRASFIGECAWTLSKIAKERQVPFIVLAQLNRESVKAKRPPTTADLKESGDLEQTAHNVVLLHPDPDEPELCDLILAKWRNGPRGIISCRFNEVKTRFESIKE